MGIRYAAPPEGETLNSPFDFPGTAPCASAMRLGTKNIAAKETRHAHVRSIALAMGDLKTSMGTPLNQRPYKGAGIDYSWTPTTRHGRRRTFEPQCRRTFCNKYSGKQVLQADLDAIHRRGCALSRSDTGLRL